MVRKQVNQETRQRRSLEKYFDEISRYTPLPSEEEIQLTGEVRKGEPLALEKLVKANLRFVITIAKRYQGHGLPLEDLISEGNLGLMKAAKKFDETRGFKFISYAVWWIKQSILQALADQTRVVRLPMNRVSAMQKVSKILEKLQKKLGREPSLNEIADDLEMTSQEVADVLKGSAHHLSLDEPFKPEEGNGLLDILENHRDPAPDDLLMQESLKDDIDKAVFSLKPREAEIIRMSFGLIGDRPLTLEEIGKTFKLSRERIRQIKDKALQRMRHTNRSKPLKKHLG